MEVLKSLWSCCDSSSCRGSFVTHLFSIFRAVKSVSSRAPKRNRNNFSLSHFKVDYSNKNTEPNREKTRCQLVNFQQQFAIFSPPGCSRLSSRSKEVFLIAICFTWQTITLIVVHAKSVLARRAQKETQCTNWNQEYVQEYVLFYEKKTFCI